MLNKASGRAAFCAVMMALALILSYIESLISFGFVFPGFRLGLSNIPVVVILYLFGAGYAVPFGILKSLLSLLFMGRLSSLFFSVSGMIFALLIMILLNKSGRFSIYSVSACGSVFHVWGQFFASAIYLSSISVFSLVPWLSLAAVFSGIIVAFLSKIIISRIGLSEIISADKKHS